jgi:hypothetical protein
MSAGVKHDQGKLRHDLLPNFPIHETIRVLMHGAKVYGDDNWKEVPNLRARYYSACKRHLDAWWDGEQLDVGEGGSNLHHLAHAMCCLVFLIQAEKEEII